MLVCQPLKPWGSHLSPLEADQLRRWARADERRMLILDSAHATPPTEQARALLDDESAILLASLSKGWLIPDHASPLSRGVPAPRSYPIAGGCE